MREKETQNIVQLTQDPDYQPLSSSGETSSDKTESKSTPDDTYKTDTCVCQGQIDNNFIEIAISGVPNEKAIKVFMLSDISGRNSAVLNLILAILLSFSTATKVNRMSL